MSLHQNNVPSYTHLVQSKLINLDRDHPSVLRQVTLVRLTLPISRLPGKDRIPPGLLLNSCTLPQSPALVNTNNLTHHPMLPSLLHQEVMFSLTFPTILLPCKVRLSLHLLHNSPTHHLHAHPVLPTLLYQHTSLGLLH